jgi:hypothetical protein
MFELILPPPARLTPAEFWAWLSAEFAKRNQEWKSLAITRSPYEGYKFINLLSDRAADEGLVEEFKILANTTLTYLPQDGVREPWVIFLDAVRTSDRTIKTVAYGELVIPAKSVRAERRTLELRQKSGADPSAVEFVTSRSTLSLEHPFSLALACAYLKSADLMLWLLRVFRANAESFEKGDQRIASVATVQIGNFEPASHQLGRVLARLCLQLAASPAADAPQPLHATVPPTPSIPTEPAMAPVDEKPEERQTVRASPPEANPAADVPVTPPDPVAAPPAGRADEVETPAQRRAFPKSVISLIAARRMEEYIQLKGMGLTEFAQCIGTTNRTLRSFRETGKIRRDYFKKIANEMGTSPEALLKPE